MRKWINKVLRYRKKATGVIRELRPFIRPEVVKALREGNLLILKEKIETEIRKGLAGQEATMTGCDCLTDGIRLAFEHGTIAKKHYDCLLRFLDIEIDEERQRVTFVVESEHLSGANLLGTILTAFARLFIREIFPKVAERISDKCSIPVVPDPAGSSQYKADLSNVSAIAKLRDIKIAGKSLLSIVRIVGGRHSTSGILLEGKLGIFYRDASDGAFANDIQQ